jgi:hypothetical protein
MPAKDSSRPVPLQRAEPVAGQEQPRTDHHEERREIDEQHRARRVGVDEPAVDQQELQAEQQTGDEARRQRVVARRNRHAAPAHHGEQDQRRERSADGALDQRRNVGERKLDRDLVEAPG